MCIYPSAVMEKVKAGSGIPLIPKSWSEITKFASIGVINKKIGVI